MKPRKQARSTKKSLSKLLSDALRGKMARPEREEIIEAVNRVCGELGSEKDEFVSLAARRILEQTKW